MKKQRKLEKTKKEEKKEIIITVLVIAGIFAVFYGGWYVLETYFWDSFSQEGQIKMLQDYIEEMEFICEIEEGVPNNYYSGKIRIVALGLVPSPFVSLFGTDLTEEEILDASTLMFEKLEALPCYTEFSDNFEGESIEQYLRDSIK